MWTDDKGKEIVQTNIQSHLYDMVHASWTDDIGNEIVQTVLKTDEFAYSTHQSLLISSMSNKKCVQRTRVPAPELLTPDADGDGQTDAQG